MTVRYAVACGVVLLVLAAGLTGCGSQAEESADSIPASESVAIEESPAVEEPVVDSEQGAGTAAEPEADTEEISEPAETAEGDQTDGDTAEEEQTEEEVEWTAPDCF